MTEGDLSRPLSNAMRVLAAVDYLGEVPGGLIAKHAGLSPRQVHAETSRMVSRSRLSRSDKPEGGGYYRYYMTDDQREAYHRLLGEVPRSGLVGVGVVSAAERLRFLRGLNERSVYAGSPVLASIISDYERTLKACAGAD